MESVLEQRFEFLGGSAAAVLCIFLIAWKFGYFKTSFPYFKGTSLVSLGDVLIIFLLFLGIELVLMPTLAWIGFSIKAGHLIQNIEKIKIDVIKQGWLNLLSVTASFIGIALFLLLQPYEKRNWIVWGGSKGNLQRGLKDFGLGVLTWLISYPVVILASQIIGIIAYFMGPPPPIDQVAVKHLKMTVGSPLLFYCTVFVIVVLVPLTEEILFRGFLQRWFVGNLGRVGGVVVTAAIFAIFHFSTSQKWENIELIISLFILALFLGYLYERQGSLWASTGLHVFFNAVSVFFITWGEFHK